MDTGTIAVVAAVIGVVATVIYLSLGWLGIRTLKDIRNNLARRARSDSDESRLRKAPRVQAQATGA